MSYFLIPLLVFAFWYLTRFYSDNGSAIESLQSVDSIEDVTEDDSQQQSENSNIKSWFFKNILNKIFLIMSQPLIINLELGHGGRRSIRVNSTYISQKNRLTRYKTALALFLPYRYAAKS